MDSLTLELFRWLQSGPYDESGLSRIRSLLRTRRRTLLAQNDQIALTEIVQLLQGWAEAAEDPALASAALTDASEIAGQDLGQPALAEALRARSRESVPAARNVPVIGAAADAALAERLSVAGDYDGAIEAYERALSSEANTDVVRKLAESYARRSGPGDAHQAADLFYTLGDVLGNPIGISMLERALEQEPTHADALALLAEYRASQPPAAASSTVNPVQKDVPAERVPVIDAPDFGALTPSASDAARSQAASLLAGSARSASGSPGARIVGEKRLSAFGSGTLVGGLRATGASPQSAQGSSAQTGSRTSDAPAKPSRSPRRTLPGGTAAVDSQWPIKAPASARADAAADRSSTAPGALRAGAASAAGRAFASPSDADRGVNATATAARASAAPGSKRTSLGPGGVGAFAAAGRASAAARPSSSAAERPSAALGWKRVTATPFAASTSAGAGRASSAPASKRASVAPSAARAGRASAASGDKLLSSALAGALSGGVPPERYVTPHLRVRSPAELEAALQRMQRPSWPQELSADGDLPLPSSSLTPVVRDDTLVVASESAPKERRKLIGAAIGICAATAAATFLAVSYGTRPAPAPVANRVDIPTPAAASAPATASAPEAVVSPAAIGGTSTQPTLVGTPEAAATAPPTSAPDPRVAATSSAGAVPAPADPGASQPLGDRPAKKAARQPAVRLLLESVDLRGGKLNEQQLSAAVDKTAPKLERCYARALEDRPRTKGRLTVGWTIQLSGRPVAVRKLGGTINNQALTRCTLQIIGTARYPKPRKQPTQVRLPIDYRRS